MSLLGMILDHDKEGVLAPVNARSTRPIEPRQATVFEFDDDVELSAVELDWLDNTGELEHAVLGCLKNYRSFRGLGDRDNAMHQLRRARAVLNHQIEQA